jgi:hypothetical protein
VENTVILILDTRERNAHIITSAQEEQSSQRDALVETIAHQAARKVYSVLLDTSSKTTLRSYRQTTVRFVLQVSTQPLTLRIASHVNQVTFAMEELTELLQRALLIIRESLALKVTIALLAQSQHLLAQLDLTMIS